MPLPAACSEEEFIELFETFGATKVSQILGINIRTVFTRRESLEAKHGRSITAPAGVLNRRSVQLGARVELTVTDGVVLVGSDAHYWPGFISTAHRAFVEACKRLKPVAVIKNGDVLDGATISRHPPIGWESRPALVQEIEECKERLGEITLAAGKARRIWPLGNHDARFETRLASVAPEYAKINGVHLKDHFPDWECCYSVWVNDEVVVKHRYRGGIHAARNNVVNGGKTIITGHLHSLKVTPVTNYNGTLFGVDCGTMADPDGPQFESQ